MILVIIRYRKIISYEKIADKLEVSVVLEVGGICSFGIEDFMQIHSSCAIQSDFSELLYRVVGHRLLSLRF
jgi:hypothetical protein